MAERSLKDLSNAVMRIAENSPKIQKDVEDIRKSICGTDGLMDAIFSLNKTVESIAKKSTGSSLSSISGSKSFEKTSKSLTKTMDNISKILSSKSIMEQSIKINKSLDDILKMISKILLQMQQNNKNSSRKKTDGLSLSTNKKSDIKYVYQMIPDSKGKNLANIGTSISIIEKLRDINLKDFIFAKQKMKHINKIMSKSLDMFKMFKNHKEAEQTLSFIDSSIDIVKKLSKIALISKPAQWGANAIYKVFFGNGKKGGLLKVFVEIHKHRKEIDNAKKQTKKISAVCGSMFLASISLAGIAVIGPVAMLGAVMTSGIIFILVGTFKLLSKSIGALMKGAIAFTVLSAGLIAFSLGFGLLRKSTKDLTLKESGVMATSIVGTGLAVAGVGLLALPIAAGSGVLLLMGASLGLFGLALKVWKDFDSKPVIDSIENAVGGLRRIFGLELGKGQSEDGFKGSMKRIGGGILDFTMSIFDFGKSFFTMGSILLAGAALGVLKKGLEPWENYTGGQAIENIGTAINSLRASFGLNEDNGKGIVGKVANFTGNLFSFAGSIFQMGETFTKMGTLVLATGAMDIIRVTLIPWEKYDSRPAIDNIRDTVNALSDAFGLRSKEENKGIKGLFNVVGDLFKTASALTEMGPTFAKLAHLVTATASMDVIRLALVPWNKYDSKPAIDNISKTVDALGLMMNERTSVIKKDDVKHFKSITLDFRKGMKNLKSGLSMSKKMRTYIDDFKGSMTPISSSIQSINSLDVEKASIMKDMFKSFAGIRNGKPFESFTKAVDKFADACQDVVKSIDGLATTGNLNNEQTQTVSASSPTVQATTPNNIDVRQIADAVKEAINSLNIRLDPSMLDINLMVEGVPGRTVKVSLMN